MENPILPLDAMDIGSGRRLSLAPEALWLENRVSGGAYVRARPVPYEEIQAVYSYEQRDWGALGLAIVAWVVLSVLCLVLAAVLNLSLGPVGALAVSVVLGVALCGLGGYRVAQHPRKMLRIDSHTGSLIVPRTHPRFFLTLGEHLDAARKRNPEALASAPPAAVPGAFPGFVPPPPGAAPPGVPPGAFTTPSGVTMPPPPAGPGAGPVAPPPAVPTAPPLPPNPSTEDSASQSPSSARAPWEA